MVRTRSGQLALVVLLFSVLGAVSYTAASPALSRLFQFTESLRTIDDLGAATELNLSQGRNGHIVVVNRAFVDANQALVEITTFSDPRVVNGGGPQVSLALADGTALPQGTVGFGVRGRSEVLGVSLPPGASDLLLGFDTSQVSGLPEQITLKLSVSMRGSQVTGPGPGATPTLDRKGQLLPTPAAATPGLATEFEFEFTVPFDGGLEMAGGEQAVEASGVPIVLARVVSTLSETRVTVRFDARTNTIPDLELKATGSGWQSPDSITEPQEGTWEFHFAKSLLDRPGIWEVKVKPDDGRARVYPAGTPTAGFIEDTVTFKFEMAGN
jgi:hypothetical protein